MVALPSYLSMVVTIIALVMIIIEVIKGYKNGLILSIYDLFSLVIALYIAYSVAGTMAIDLAIVPDSLTNGLTIVSNELFDSMIDMVVNYFVNWLIWFVLVVLIIRIILHFIRKIFKGIDKIPLVNTINEYAGAIFGLIKAMIMIVIMGYVLSLPLFTNGVQIRQESLIEPVIGLSRSMFSFIDESLDINETINGITNGLTDLSQLSANQLDQLIQSITDTFDKE